jgi:anti-sigma B factor antagonist
MEYNITMDEKWVVISVTGAINFKGSDELRSLFENVLLEGTKYVRLNLRRVPVANSAGLGNILMLYKNLKKREGMLEIKGISDNLFEMLKLVKIDKLIKIERE